MASFLASFRGETYALFRIVTGFLFAAHGSQKLLSYPFAAPPTLPDFVVYVGGPIELIGGLLVMIGLYTRYAGFLASGLMAAAYWMAHGMTGLFPIANGGELAVLYCFGFLFIACQGGGMWSADQAMSPESTASGD